MLPDVVEIGSLPSFVREGEGTVHAFYILTRQGLRIECSNISKIQVLLICFCTLHSVIIITFVVSEFNCFSGITWSQCLVLHALDVVTVLRTHCTVTESEHLSCNSFLSVVLWPMGCTSPWLCFTRSVLQVDSWLAALQTDFKLGSDSDSKSPNGLWDVKIVFQFFFFTCR